MLNRELPDILQAIYKCMDIKGEKFAYALLKNKVLVENKLKSIYDIMKTSEEFNEYDKKRVELAEKYAKKDEDGNPKNDGKKYDIDNKEEFEKEVSKLKEENAELIKEQEEKNKLYELEMDKESDVEFHKVKAIPKDISARELEAVTKFMYKE